MNDSFLFLRRAIEFCAFAALVKRHPDMAMAWINANDGSESYENYPKKFNQRSLFPKSGPLLLVELYERYDRCSKIMHGSIHSLAGQVDFVGAHIEYRYFDVRPGDLHIVSRFYYLIDTHRRILGVFAGIFAKELSGKRSEWDVAFNAVEAKTNYHRERWKQVIPNPLAQQQHTSVSNPASS